MPTTKQKINSTLLLFLAALIWGASFVAQDEGAAIVPPYTYQATRTLLGALALLLVCGGRVLWQKKRGSYVAPTRTERRTLLIGGVICGLLLCTATVLQQFGIASNVTSPGKDAFITALYIVFVPILGLFIGKRADWHIYPCVAVALGGLWLLCMSGSTLSVGALQLILCSVVFAVHILVVGHFAPLTDGLWLSAIQFTVSGLICAVLMFIFENPSLPVILDAWMPIAYSGLLSTAGGYTLQILGMRHSPPTVASLVMSLESVFAVISSMILLPEIAPFTAREWIGMVLIFAAITVSQLNFPAKKRKGAKEE
jgi:drug/metabolite transporter (DMT)-like permease